MDPLVVKCTGQFAAHQSGERYNQAVLVKQGDGMGLFSLPSKHSPALPIYSYTEYFPTYQR